MPTPTAIIPGLGYNDAPAAIEFLCEAFGFTRHAVHASVDGLQIHHAQLMLGNSMIMLGSTSPKLRARLGMVSPIETNHVVTGNLYVVLDAVVAHHAVAVSRGAVAIMPPHDNDHGGGSYEVRDCEERVWSFGSYDRFG